MQSYHGSIFEQVLARARKVKRTGRQTALISCPAAGHDDRRPSVTVTETPDGTVLMRCWSQGCSFAEMVAGLGLTQSQFFPRTTRDFSPPLRRLTPASDILNAAADEIVFAYVVMADLQKWLFREFAEGRGIRGITGQPPGPSTRARFLTAVERVGRAASAASGREIDIATERREILRSSLLTEAERAELEDVHG